MLITIGNNPADVVSRLLLRYLDVTYQHVAADDRWGDVRAGQFDLNVPKCFLVFIPVNTVL